MVISNCYLVFKNYHEYMPLVSTGTSLVKIFNATYLHHDNVFSKNHRYTSLRKITPLRVIILLIPVFGNILIGIYDLKKYEHNHFTLTTVQLNGLSLEYASDDAQDNKKIVRAASLQNSKSFQFASLRLRNNLQLVRDLMENDLSVLYFAGEALRQDKTFILEMISKHGISVLRYIDTEVQNDEHFISLIAKKNPSALKYSTRLRKDELFFSSLIEFDPHYFKSAHPDLRKDKLFVSKLMKINSKVLKFASDEIRSNEEFIEEQMYRLIRDNIDSFLSLFSDELRSNLEFIERQKSRLIRAVFKCSLLSNDKKYITKKLKGDLSFLRLADDEIRNDKDFISQFRDQNFEIIKYANPNIQADVPFIIKCIQDYELSLKWLDEPLQNHPDIILSLIKKGSCEELEWMGVDLQRNSEFAEMAVSINGESLCYFTTDVINNQKLLKIALKSSVKPLEKINFSLKQNSQFFLELIHINPIALSHANENLREDKSFNLEAVKQNPKALYYSQFLDDECFIFELVKMGVLDYKYPSLLQSIPAGLDALNRLIFSENDI